MTDFLHFAFPGLPVSKEKELARALLVALKFDPNQPRDEAGKWTDTGAGTGPKEVEFTRPGWTGGFIPGGWEEMIREAPYVSTNDPNVLITTSPSVEKNREGWTRINYWDKDGIQYHEEFAPDKIQRELKTRTYPRGGVIIRAKPREGKYPSADKFQDKWVYAAAIDSNGNARRFVGMPAHIPSILLKLRREGWEVNISKVPDNTVSNKEFSLKYSPDQPRDDNGRWADNPYSNSESSLSGPISIIANIGKSRLMPPQYQEMLSAIAGKTSESTKKYWFDVLRKWAESEYDYGEIDENDYNEILRKLS